MRQGLTRSALLPITCSLALAISQSDTAALLAAQTAPAKTSASFARAKSNKKTHHAKSKDKTASSKPPLQGSVLLQAMREEMDRWMAKLKNGAQVDGEKEAPLYFLSYAVYDVYSLDLQSDYGALYTHSDADHDRYLDINLRVGSPKVDNTHKIRGGSLDLGSILSRSSTVIFPNEDDRYAIRVALWERTDAAYKQAQSDYRKVVTDKNMRVEEEDKSDDFSLEPPHQYSEPQTKYLDIDRAAWETTVKQLSSIFKKYPEVQDSNVSFTVSKVKRTLVTSEGTNIEDSRLQYRISALANATADDGMKLWLYDGVEASSLDQLPDRASMEKMVEKLAADVVALRSAKRAEPYVGPAILRSKAAGVFFHEIFGHRIEGHRQKDESEGRTFAKKLDTQIMPSFISVVDDPTRQVFGKKVLNGYYKYDDEGVPAQKVTLVKDGVLKTYLMGRSPIKGVSTSNGHGRCSHGHAPVARQGNLIVESSKKVPYEELRQMLVAEIKKQGKPYGLIFDEIAGGFTMTQTFFPQSFKLLPLRVWRVYADGRPDELLRGVDLVGTPLTSLERIRCAADDDDTFNGTCGAESGWVPVSANSPSLLVDTIEVELQNKDQDKPPLLPPPLAAKQTEETQK